MSSKLIKPDHKTLASATAETIQKAIQEGTYPPGSQLPSEFDLIDMLGVSRTTLREALKSLEAQRFIIRKRGRGTFVNDHPIIKDLSLNFGISEMIAQAGFTPGVIDSSVDFISADREISKALNLSEGDEVIKLDRVGTANQNPVVWSIDIVPAFIFDNEIPADFYPELLSIYDYLQENLHLRILHGEATIRPELATSQIASKLDISERNPILVISQIDFDDEDRPILYSIEYHLPDKFVFFIQRKGPSW
jgi:GntR family transcriptional regulator